MLEGLITSVEPQERRGGRRSNVYVDGRYAFSLESGLAAALRVGQPISALKTAELLWNDQLARCYDSAIRFLGHRPRSEQEVRQRLTRHGYPDEIVDRVVEKLRGLDLIDDAAFAQYWVEQRQTHRPRGARLIKVELRQKGLAADLASEAVSGLDDEADGAYRAAERKARTLRGLDERTFRQRLGGFLQRRGFDYESTASAVNRLWEETRG
jgi:regulatory protein